MSLDIAIHTYTLQSSSSLNSRSISCERQGALLKVIFDSEVIGYADCHPWPELGDAPLEEQLRQLKKGILTKLTTNSLQFARLDGEARALGHSLFEKHLPIKNHLLVPDVMQWSLERQQHVYQQGMTHIKFKLGRDLKQEIKQLLQLLDVHQMRFRFDFNEKLTLQQYCYFIEHVEPVWQSIDFIEDPTPFQPEEWRWMQSEYPIPLACDRHVHQALDHPDSTTWWVIKPAIQMIENYRHLNKIIITSYLDHPIGQLAAALVATQFPSAVHGLLTHRLYVSNPFSTQLTQQGPLFNFPLGTGWGFDQELKQLAWHFL